jgi:acyl dehydratase
MLPFPCNWVYLKGSAVQLSTEFTGAQTKPLQKEITWRDTMNYAASVGDRNPYYLDDERAGGVIAPPMMAVAITWAVSSRLVEFLDAEGFPGEIIPQQVHYSECLDWHRPIRPGDTLTISGQVVLVEPHLGNVRTIVRYDAHDGAGRLVFTEHTGALFRGVKCLGEGRCLDGVPDTPRAPRNGDPLWSAIVPIDPLAAHVYDGCADISFGIHTSPVLARSVGLPGIILQGTATLSHAVREIINREAGGDPTCLQRVACRFSGMVFPGTEIAVEALQRETDNGVTAFAFNVRGPDGRRVISDGHALVRA